MPNVGLNIFKTKWYVNWIGDLCTFVRGGGEKARVKKEKRNNKVIIGIAGGRVRVSLPLISFFCSLQEKRSLSPSPSNRIQNTERKGLRVPFQLKEFGAL